MKHVIEHPLDPATARRAVESAFSEYRRRYSSYDPKLSWTSSTEAEASLRAKGVGLRGRVTLGEHAMTLEVDVPLILRVFQKRAIQVIEREVRVWIEKAGSGELG